MPEQFYNGGIEKLTDEQKHHLFDSDTFCMHPWIHMHAFPDGRAFPCCMYKTYPESFSIGSLKENTLEELWNSEKYKQVRKNMLCGKPNMGCSKCYDQEKFGFYSMRNSSNKLWGHLIDLIDDTLPDGYYADFKLRFWDIRFSNLCNLKCRTCGPWFSSMWYDDQLAMHGHADIDAKVIYAGKTKYDALDQLLEHINSVERIYFAGGEPLIMEEHYIILNKLIEINRAKDVTLVYNTNLSEMRYKNQYVIPLWKQFKHVSIGASLDAMGGRAELMRKGTDWAQVEQNRRDLLEQCPEVDFYISATLSLMNALHIIDFHNDWMDKGLLTPASLNINILQEPSYYRIDCLPAHLKDKIREKYNQHIDKIQSQDDLERATNGFSSAITFMDDKDNTHLLPKFNSVTKKLDDHRKESFYDVFPELITIKDIK